MKAATKIGFITVPAVPGAVIAVVEQMEKVDDIFPIAGLLIVGYVISGLVTLLLGYPLYLLFQRHKLVRWWSVIGASALIGAMLGVVLQLPDALSNRVIGIYGLAGAASGVLWWLCWKVGDLREARLGSLSNL